MGFLFFFCSCSSPLKAIKPYINQFTEKYPNQFEGVESEGQKIQYAWAGDRTKRPLVFVHGCPGSWQGWAEFLMNDNLQKRFFLIAVDRLGYGLSRGSKTITSLDQQARAIEAIVKKHSNKLKPILVGHSYGGPVIAQMAMISPDDIGGLIFVSSAASPELEETKWFQYPASWWPLRHLIPRDLRTCNEEIFSLKNELIQQTPKWPLIKSPVVILHGEEDSLVPIENGTYIASKISMGKLIAYERFPKQGHFVPWEKPQSILKAIDLIEHSLQATDVLEPPKEGADFSN